MLSKRQILTFCLFVCAPLWVQAEGAVVKDTSDNNRPVMVSETVTDQMATKTNFGDRTKIPFKQDTVTTEQMFAPYALLLLLLLMGAIWWYVRRKAVHGWVNQPDGEALYLVKRQRLSARSTLYLVRYANQELLLVEHPNGVNVLSQSNMPVPEPLPEESSKK